MLLELVETVQAVNLSLLHTPLAPTSNAPFDHRSVPKPSVFCSLFSCHLPCTILLTAATTAAVHIAVHNPPPHVQEMVLIGE